MSDGPRRLVVRNRYMLIVDVIILSLASWISFALRFESITFYFLVSYGLYLVVTLPVKLLIFYRHKLYGHYWTNIGPDELVTIAVACTFSGLLTTVIVFTSSMVRPEQEILIPRSIPLIDALLTFICVLTIRFSPRAYANMSSRHRSTSKDDKSKRILIVGAGHTGIQVLYALEFSNASFKVVGFLDDDIAKIGTYVRGIKVLGPLKALENIVTEYTVSEVLLAVPSASGNLVRKMVEGCRRLNITYKIMPNFYELVTGKITVNTLRPVSIDDLLRRAPVSLDTSDLAEQLKGRCILITGAGGSLGSELARQIARFNPGMLLLLGHGENSLFTIDNRLQQEFPEIQRKIILADIRDMPKLTSYFDECRPDFVFHAAAHKHVPMLESNSVEAVTNNVVGTQNLIELCNRFETERMVMISTDKAVSPTNIMGMSKRAAELLILDASTKYPRRFTAVRFGNVLGSRGSVVPIFQQQIAARGPVTITSKEMTRFFMSIPEAVLLVLKASVIVGYGPLFVLNMGEPVRIMDLASDMIRLSGLEPGKDIEFEFSGLRPGEKLYEALFWDYESHKPLENGALFTICTPREHLQIIATEIKPTIERLIQAAQQNDELTVRSLLKTVAYSYVHREEAV